MKNLGLESAPVTIAGGELDPTITNADVYIGVPPRAGHFPGAACRATKSYVDLVRAGRFTEVVELFAENAVVLEPSGTTLRGHDEIGKFYTDTIGKMRPDIIDVAYTGDGTDCMVVLAVRINIAGQPRYKLASVDHFTLDAAGKFSRMVAFARPLAAAK
jgi:hypothetical protein